MLLASNPRSSASVFGLRFGDAGDDDPRHRVSGAAASPHCLVVEVREAHGAAELSECDGAEEGRLAPALRATEDAAAIDEAAKLVDRVEPEKEVELLGGEHKELAGCVAVGLEEVLLDPRGNVEAESEDRTVEGEVVNRENCLAAGASGAGFGHGALLGLALEGRGLAGLVLLGGGLLGGSRRGEAGGEVARL